MSIIRRRKLMDSNKKKKILQICDPKEKDLYNRDLVKILKNLCEKLQK